MFPSIHKEIGEGITLSASKWPKTRVEVLFDLRDELTKADHEENRPSQTLSTGNYLWADERSCP